MKAKTWRSLLRYVPTLAIAAVLVAWPGASWSWWIVAITWTWNLGLAVGELIGEAMERQGEGRKLELEMAENRGRLEAARAFRESTQRQVDRLNRTRWN